jgi:glycosyltransferase involved in cell wall biosynthesis
MPKRRIDECYASPRTAATGSARIAVYTLTMNRIEYTKRMLDSIGTTTGVRFDHFVIDNGSSDGTVEYLRANANRFAGVRFNRENVGIGRAANAALDLIGPGYDYIVKVDNDCEFVDPTWLAALVDVSRASSDRIVLSPRVEGLGAGLEGGAPRYETTTVGSHPVGLACHVGGLCEFSPVAALRCYRFPRSNLHGNYDVRYSIYVRMTLGYRMGYVEDVSVRHMDTTTGQELRYPQYFAERPTQRMTVFGEPYVVTRLLWPLRRFVLLRAMHRAGIIDETEWARAARKLGRMLKVAHPDDA